MPVRRSERGMAVATIVVLLILVPLAIVMGRSFVQSGLSLDQRAVTETNLRRISEALVQYASLNRRLPCPASGNLDTGDANPDAATTAAPPRTVPSHGARSPWSARRHWTAGAGRSRIACSWARTASRRPVSMTLCYSSLDPPLDSALDANSLCKAANATTVVPPNTPAQFLAARGNMLVVQELGTARNGNAFVLISHGESGLGAWTAEGGAGVSHGPTAIRSSDYRPNHAEYERRCLSKRLSPPAS